MNTSKWISGVGTQRTAWRRRTTVATIVMALGSTIALAAAPPANTVINAQATASYVDGNGTTQVATSNTVQTVVQQVGAFSVSAGSGLANTDGSSTAGSSKLGAPGASIVVPYTITNTGNGTDTFTLTVADLLNGGNAFSKIDAFSDQADGNGVADNTTSLLTTNAGKSTAPLTIASGSSYHLVVVYTIAASATSSWVGKASATVQATNATIGYASRTQVVADTVGVATGAAFGVSNSIGAPSVAAAPAVPVVTTNNGWGATPASGPRGSTTTYTINYTNNGAATGTLYVKDALPAGLTYIAGTAVWSTHPGTALAETASAGVANNTGIDFVVTGNVVEAVIPSVNAGASGTLSFRVTASTTAAIGTSQTSNSVSFSVENCGATSSSVATVATANGGTGCAPSTISATSATAFTVTPTYAVQINSADATPGQGDGTSDVITQAHIVPGSSVKFTIPVKNVGDSSDTFKLGTTNGIGAAAIAFANQFPSGSQFTWFASDGLTPLQNTAGGSGVDTGPIAASATVNVVLQVAIPVGTTVSSTANLQTIAVATSVSDSTRLDGTHVVVTQVIGGLVDLTATASGTAADIGPGNATAVQTISVTAGGTGNSTTASPSSAGNAVFDLYIRNGDAITLSFDLQVSQTAAFPGNLPAGWSIKFYSDAALTTPVAQAQNLAAGAQAHLYAVVTPPATATSVSGQDLYFRVISTSASTSGAVVSDYLRDQINVTAASARSFTLSASNSGQVSPGGAATFAHTVANTGTLACAATTGHLNIAVTLPGADTTIGWSSVAYIDNGSTVGSIDAGDTLITNGQLSSLSAGQQIPLLIRIFAPSGAVANSSATATVTVTDPDPTPNCGSQTLTDSATVTSGQIAISKFQVLDATCAGTATPISAASITARPGQCVIYKVVATNNGSSAVESVTVNGVVPAYTSYASTQPTVQCAATGLSGTPAALSLGTSTVQCGGTGNALSSGGSVTLQYSVRVND